MHYTRRFSYQWKGDKPVINKEGKKIGINQSEKSKQLLKIGNKKVNKLLKRCFFEYLKEMIRIWIRKKA